MARVLPESSDSARYGILSQFYGLRSSRWVFSQLTNSITPFLLECAASLDSTLPDSYRKDLVEFSCTFSDEDTEKEDALVLKASFKQESISTSVVLSKDDILARCVTETRSPALASLGVFGGFSIQTLSNLLEEKGILGMEPLEVPDTPDVDLVHLHHLEVRTIAGVEVDEAGQVRLPEGFENAGATVSAEDLSGLEMTKKGTEVVQEWFHGPVVAFIRENHGALLEAMEARMERVRRMDPVYEGVTLSGLEDPPAVRGWEVPPVDTLCTVVPPFAVHSFSDEGSGMVKTQVNLAVKGKKGEVLDHVFEIITLSNHTYFPFKGSGAYYHRVSGFTLPLQNPVKALREQRSAFRARSTLLLQGKEANMRAGVGKCSQARERARWIVGLARRFPSASCWQLPRTPGSGSFVMPQYTALPEGGGALRYAWLYCVQTMGRGLTKRQVEEALASNNRTSKSAWKVEVKEFIASMIETARALPGGALRTDPEDVEAFWKASGLDAFKTMEYITGGRDTTEPPFDYESLPGSVPEGEEM